MLTKIPLRELVNECAQMHKSLLLEKPKDIRRNITAVKHAIIARKTYERGLTCE